MASTKKLTADHLQECDFCGLCKIGLLRCSRCNATSYCDADCQRAHWNAPAGHKKFCVALKDRAPVSSKKDNVSSACSNVSSKCPICLETLTIHDQFMLACGHYMHTNCVRLYREIGVSKFCPLCRRDLDVGASDVYPSPLHALLDFGRLRRTLAPHARLDNFPSQHKDEFKAIAQSIEIGAEKGNNDCINILGYFCEYGIGVPINVRRAFSLYQSAANAGHAGGQCHLGQSYTRGIGCDIDEVLAFHWFTLSAAGDDRHGQYNLGCAYLKGKGCEKNGKVAKDLFEVAASNGCGNSYYALGQLYRCGLGGVAIDLKKAKQYFENGSSLKDGNCTEVLGVFMGSGVLQEPDQVAAIRLYELAARQGNPKGFYQVALMHSKGCGTIPRNVDLAMKFFAKGAHYGDLRCKTKLALFELDKPNNTPRTISSVMECLVSIATMGEDHAQMQLGVIYHVGMHGIEKNLATAVVWYERAIESERIESVIPAARNLSNIYRTGGGGILKDEMKSFQLNELVAVTGDADALFLRFIHHYNGLGVPQDYVLAIESLHDAITHGHVEAMVTLSSLKKKIRQRVETGHKSEVTKSMVKLLWKK